MFDSTPQQERGTSRRDCSADQDAVRAMGFRDCAVESIRFLTQRARLDPHSDVVQGIRSLIDVHFPHIAAADINASSDDDRHRRTSWNVEERENLPLTTRKCLDGRINRRRTHSNRFRGRRVLSATVDNQFTTPSPSLSICATDMSRVEQSGTPVDDDSRRRRSLRTLQTAAVSSTSTLVGSSAFQFQRDVDVTTASDVAECASELVNLAQTDARVRNVLTELLQLMDAAE